MSLSGGLVEGSTPPRRPRSWATRYGVAALALALAFLIQALFAPFVQGEIPFLLLSAAVLAGAAFGGLGPGVFATTLGALIGDYFFLSPVGTLVPPDLGHGLRTGLFLAQGLAISAIGAWLASARRRAEASVRQAQEDRESLRESEERQRLMIESVKDYAIFMVDPDGRVADWNPGAERLFGYREEEVLGRDTALFFTPEDVRDGAHERELRVAASEGRAEDERWHVRRDGSRFFASGIATDVRDARGNLRGFAKVARDVTERRRAEDAQRFLAEAGGELTSSLDYRATLSGVARLAVPRIADWCAVDVVAEDGSLERLAVEHEDPEKVALAHELQERYPPDPDASYGVPHVLRTGEPELVLEIPQALLEEAARDEGHREIIRELGLRSYIVVPMVARGKTLGAITLVSAESGRRYGQADLKLAEELARRAALAVDNAKLYEEAREEIAERERAEEALRESEERLRLAVEATGLGTFDLDPATGYLTCDERAKAAFGLPPEVEVDYETFLAVVHSEDRAWTDRAVRRALNPQGGGGFDVEYRTVGLQDGVERWVAARGRAFFDEEGRAVRLVGTVLDVTERKRTEEALGEIREAERNRMARELHDGALQDFTYGLAEVQIARMVSEDPKLDERLGHAIEALRRAEQGLRDSIYGLRGYANRDQGVEQLLESLVELNRRRAPGTEIDLDVEKNFFARLSEREGMELLRVVQEAFTNARRHSGARNVRVTLNTEGDDALVAVVADDGRGFDAETPPGMGTRSMRERAAALGGTLEVESEPGRGTRVRLRVARPS